MNTRPHTTPADFNEGPQAADAFRKAMARLVSVPPKAAARPTPHARKSGAKKK
jgi:hypothetical protein